MISTFFCQVCVLSKSREELRVVSWSHDGERGWQTVWTAARIQGSASAGVPVEVGPSLPGVGAPLCLDAMMVNLQDLLLLVT